MNSNYGSYLQNRNGIYYFLFTVPKDQIARFGKRQIRESLRTRDRKQALIKLGPLIDRHVRMVSLPTKDAVTIDDVREASDYLGIQYVESNQLEKSSDAHAVAIYAEVLHALKKVPNPNVTEAAALTGAISIPALTVSQLLPLYKQIVPEKVANKPKKVADAFWRNYERSAEVFVEMMGEDMNVLTITGKDIIHFRTMLVARIENEEFKSAYANRQLMNIRRMIEAVVPVEYNVDLINWKTPYYKVKNLTGFNDDGKRPPLSETEVKAIRNNIDCADIHPEIKAMMMIAEWTGAGITELSYLAPEDVVLDTEMPHIKIRPNAFRKTLKTLERKRDIPLIGNALTVARSFPDAFPTFRDPRNIHKVYNQTNRFIKEHAPGKSFAGYRHRVAELLRNSDCKDQTQNAVMGHSTPGMTGHYGGPVWISRMKTALQDALPGT